VSDPADDDYSDESDGFEEVRDAGQSSRRAERSFGDPIMIDDRIANLSEVEQEVLESFVEEARKECKKIMNKKDLRTVPFTDTMLREMGLQLPSTQDEMRRIPGIDPLKVDLYSKPFLALTSRWRQSRNDMMLGAQNPIKPFDPNHQIVDLVSDDAENSDNEELSDQETSAYFPNTNTKAAADFNMQINQAQEERQAAQSAKTKKRPAADDSRTSESRKRSSGGGRSFAKKFAFKDKKKNDAGPSRSTSGGEAPKRKSSSTYTANTGRAKSRAPPAGAASGGAGQRKFMPGGIGMMPT